MRGLLRWALALAVAVCGPVWLHADTIETKQDERIKGQIVREGPKQVVVRTPYGELALPRGAVKKHTRAIYVVELKDGSKVEGQILGEKDGTLSLKVDGKSRTVPRADVKRTTEKRAPKPPRKPSPQELLKLHRTVLDHFKKKNHKAALATCKKILATHPDDPTALYNAACACAVMGQKPAALDYLKKAVAAGFVDFAHIAKDTDLASLRRSLWTGMSLQKRVLAAGLNMPPMPRRNTLRESAPASSTM
ncbi:hypothetical protein ACFL09_05600 [Planctomycetota bacterium]